MFKKKYLIYVFIVAIIAISLPVINLAMKKISRYKNENYVQIKKQQYIETQRKKGISESTYTKEVPILLYHHIAEEVASNTDYTITSELFESHIKALAEAGYNTLTVYDIVSYIDDGVEFPDKSVLITFDDGYMSNYEYAYPILKKYNLKAAIFMIGAAFGNKNEGQPETTRFFGIEEMEEMEESGLIEIEAHTYNLHQSTPDKDGIIYENILIKEGESDEDYKKRIEDDLKKWESTIGKSVTALAYPLGKSDLKALNVLKELGVKLTFTTQGRTDKIIKNYPLSGYNLGRYIITQKYTAEDLIKLLDEQIKK